MEQTDLLWFIFLICITFTVKRQYHLKRLRRVNRLRGLVISSHRAALEWKTPTFLFLAILSGMNIGLSWLLDSPVALAQKPVEPLIEAQPTALPFSLLSTPSRTPTSISTPTRTPSPTPTLLPIPTTGVIWHRENGWVYFWESPGQGILAQIPNGTVVTFLDEWEPYGGQAWARVESDGQAGWVEATAVWRVTMQGTFPMVIEGTYLYSEPAGKQLVWLSPGTPVRPGVGWMPPATPTVQIVDLENQQRWILVTLLDGTEGWIQSETMGRVD